MFISIIFFFIRYYHSFTVVLFNNQLTCMGWSFENYSESLEYFADFMPSFLLARDG